MFPSCIARRGVLAGLAALVLLSQPAFAGSFTLTVAPAADTTLFQVAPDNALGGADFFNAGTAANSSLNRALLFFDLTGLLPSGAQITSVLLTLDVVRQPVGDPESSVFSLRRMSTSWGEGETYQAEPNSPGLGAPAQLGDATWNHRYFNETPWTVPGGLAGVDFSHELSSTTIVYGLGDAVMFENTPEMVADVQFWLEHPELNFGWMLKTESEAQRRTARSFASRESGFGPTLTIDYVVVPEPATWWFLGLAAGAAWLARRPR